MNTPFIDNTAAAPSTPRAGLVSRFFTSGKSSGAPSFKRVALRSPVPLAASLLALLAGQARAIVETNVDNTNFAGQISPDDGVEERLMLTADINVSSNITIPRCKHIVFGKF